MDALSEPGVHTVVVISSAQVGKTEIINNVVGYYIDQDPAPVLLLQPTLEMAQTWSKDRLAPMLRDTPALHGKIKDPRSRDSGNTMLHKAFPGGHITMAGANSPASLASRPIRIVLLDEVDRYPASAGSEGDPVALAVKRSTTFWNRRVVMVSTPTVAGISRIEAAYEESDKRRFWVSCPECSEGQTLKWTQVRWPEGQPIEARYHCEHCGVEWTDAQRWSAIRKGEWHAEAEFTGVAGFHLSELYSTWVKLGETAKAFCDAKANPERLKTWVNTALGETWQEKGEAPEWERLYERREDYRLVPALVALLTAGVDVQKDRIEVSVWGWGSGRESWLIEHRVLMGDTSRPEVWDDLTEMVAESWERQDGQEMHLSRVAVDTGYATTEVHLWARRQRPGLAIPIKGVSGGSGLVGAPSAVDVSAAGKRMRRGAKVWPVGTHIAKSETYGWLRLSPPTEESGEDYPPGYIHLPKSVGEEFCKQLTAEQLVTRVVKGYRKPEWQKTRERNEALDCRVYARAAAVTLGVERWSDKKWQELAGGEHGRSEQEREDGAAKAAKPQPSPSRRRARRVSQSSYV